MTYSYAVKSPIVHILAKELEKFGYVVVVSEGKSAKQRLDNNVDLVALKRDKTLLFYVTNREYEKTIRIKPKHVANLEKVKETTGIEPYIAVYMNTKKSFYIFTLDRVHKTLSGSYTISYKEFLQPRKRPLTVAEVV